MATSTIKKMLKSKEVSVTLRSGRETDSGSSDILLSQIVSVVQRKTEDLFFEPIIFSVYDDGRIEVRTISKTSATANRTYKFLVWYI